MLRKPCIIPSPIGMYCSIPDTSRGSVKGFVMPCIGSSLCSKLPELSSRIDGPPGGCLRNMAFVAKYAFSMILVKARA